MKTCKFSELKMRQVFGLKKGELNLIRCKEFDNGGTTRVNSQQLKFSRYWFISPDTVVYTFGHRARSARRICSSCSCARTYL